MENKKKQKCIKKIEVNKICLGMILLVCLVLSACGNDFSYSVSSTINLTGPSDWKENLPPYTGKESIALNNNVPYFTEEEITTEVFENYSELDGLGRCQVAFANICQELMPTTERGQIGNVRPSGWHTVKYDVIADKYLYNRCHLIGFQLAGENANEKNLITGTRYLNVEGMLPWENKVADYVKDTGNHVLYRVTPDFEGDNLVASGVRIEAFSVEDEGAGICFHVYCYNVQPGVGINYADGESWLDEDGTGGGAKNGQPEDMLAQVEQPTDEMNDASEHVPITEKTENGLEGQQKGEEKEYVLNTNTKRFHYPHCDSVSDMKDKNRENFKGKRETLIDNEYVPCKRCKP